MVVICVTTGCGDRRLEVPQDRQRQAEKHGEKAKTEHEIASQHDGYPVPEGVGDAAEYRDGVGHRLTRQDPGAFRQACEAEQQGQSFRVMPDRADGGGDALQEEAGCQVEAAQQPSRQSDRQQEGRQTIDGDGDGDCRDQLRIAPADKVAAGKQAQRRRTAIGPSRPHRGLAVDNIWERNAAT